jgi:DNA processing protein
MVRQPPLPLWPAAGPARAISPFLDLGAYEALWIRPGASFRALAALFRDHPGALPSDLVSPEEAERTARAVLARLHAAGVGRFGVRVHGSPEYPARLRDALHPVELLTFQGWWNLVEAPSVAVVGTREPSSEGLARTRRLVHRLVEDGWTVASGLAAGIDTAAHRAALEAGGSTYAVLGTPLSAAYPPENAALQRRLAGDHLVASPVPVELYARQDWRANRRFFPARGIVLSALTAATLVVEAGDTSGTLAQARAALQQGRPLLVLDSCFRAPGLTWPHRYERWGALRVRDLAGLRRALADAHRLLAEREASPDAHPNR